MPRTGPNRAPARRSAEAKWTSEETLPADSPWPGRSIATARKPAATAGSTSDVICPAWPPQPCTRSTAGPAPQARPATRWPVHLEREVLAARQHRPLLIPHPRPQRREEQLARHPRRGAGSQRARHLHPRPQPGRNRDGAQTTGRAIYRKRGGRERRPGVAWDLLAESGKGDQGRLRSSRVSKALRARASARGSSSSLATCWKTMPMPTNS